MSDEWPELCEYQSEGEYRTHFERVYCKGTISTHDEIEVRFSKKNFDHCFYESSQRDRNKDQFSWQRADRIDWIKATLQSPQAILKQGWDRDRRRNTCESRVALVKDEYVVVIRLTSEKEAFFVTAYVADDPYSIQRIKGSPRWKNPYTKA